MPLLSSKDSCIQRVVLTLCQSTWRYTCVLLYTGGIHPSHAWAGLTDLQIQAEVKSDVSVEDTGRKVVINFGCGEHRLTVEATPDFLHQKTGTSCVLNNC